MQCFPVNFVIIQDTDPAESYKAPNLSEYIRLLILHAFPLLEDINTFREARWHTENTLSITTLTCLHKPPLLCIIMNEELDRRHSTEYFWIWRDKYIFVFPRNIGPITRACWCQPHQMDRWHQVGEITQQPNITRIIIFSAFSLGFYKAFQLNLFLWHTIIKLMM